jgi:hypothetical protein
VVVQPLSSPGECSSATTPRAAAAALCSEACRLNPRPPWGRPGQQAGLGLHPAGTCVLVPGGHVLVSAACPLFPACFFAVPLTTVHD